MLSSNTYADTPPQEFLNKLHDIAIPELYDPGLSKEQRLNLINYKREKLRDWRQRLSETLNIIDERHDADHQREAKLAAAPYELLDDLGVQLKTAVDELEKTMKKGRVLPEGFVFGDIIYGEHAWGEWHLGDRRDKERFEDMVAVKNRLDSLKAEYKPLMRDMKLSQARIKELKGDLQSMMVTYKTQSKASYIALRLLVVFVLGAVMIAAGYFLYTSGDTTIISDTADTPVAGALFVGGVCAVIAMIVIYRRRNRRLEELKEDIQRGRQRLSQLRATFKKQRSEYYPLNQLMKELTGDYKALRETFA